MLLLRTQTLIITLMLIGLTYLTIYIFIFFGVVIIIIKKKNYQIFISMIQVIVGFVFFFSKHYTVLKRKIMTIIDKHDN